MKFPIALQPFTIRDEIDLDYFGAFEQVVKIGYQAIEIGLPPNGITIPEMKARFNQIGLKVISCHAGIEQLTNNLDTLIDFLQQFDATYLVLSAYRFESKESVMEAAKLFNQIGENCRKRGVQFLYHNHDWEFVKFDGEYAYDLMLQATDPELVQVELDTYWVQKAGEDPVAYLRKLKNRCPLLHVKDMESGAEGFFAEVGEGILDFIEIINVAEEVGTEWLVVEQDHCRTSPMECITTSFRNLKRMGFI